MGPPFIFDNFESFEQTGHTTPLKTAFSRFSANNHTLRKHPKTQPRAALKPATTAVPVNHQAHREQKAPASSRTTSKLDLGVKLIFADFQIAVTLSHHGEMPDRSFFREFQTCILLTQITLAKSKERTYS